MVEFFQLLYYSREVLQILQVQYSVTRLRFLYREDLQQVQEEEEEEEVVRMEVLHLVNSRGEAGAQARRRELNEKGRVR